MSPYDLDPGETSAREASSVATRRLTPVAVPSPSLVAGSERSAASPGSRNASPSPVTGTTVGSDARTRGCGVAPVSSSARSARTMPRPVRESIPAGARSSAVAPNAARRSAFVVPGLPDSTSAAMRCEMRRGGGGAEERPEAPHGRIDTVGAGEVGLLPHRAPGRGVVPGRDRRAVGVEEHAPRAVGCEALRRLVGGEDPRERSAGIGGVARLQVERTAARQRVLRRS